jgi:hypothetical protein
LDCTQTVFGHRHKYGGFDVFIFSSIYQSDIVSPAAIESMNIKCHVCIIKCAYDILV